jgi:hypothetical protein
MNLAIRQQAHLKQDGIHCIACRNDSQNEQVITDDQSAESTMSPIDYTFSTGQHESSSNVQWLVHNGKRLEQDESASFVVATLVA